MPEVSVIVPCYGVGKYLPRISACLAAQSYRGEWEAIFVDDGDPEGECVYAAITDPRFRVIHKPNGGLSSARNFGIEHSRGKIILFCDPDDEVAPIWIERLVAGLEGDRSKNERPVDLVWSGFVSEFKGEKERHIPYDVGCEYSGAEVRRRVWKAIFGYRLRDVFRYWTHRRMWRGCKREYVGICSRGYRRDVIGNLRFDERIGLFEDAIFVAEYALRAQSMRIIGDTGYHYYIRQQGLMVRERKKQMVRHKFELRDARMRLDPHRDWWGGSFLLSAAEVTRDAGIRAGIAYLLGQPFPDSRPSSINEGILV